MIELTPKENKTLLYLEEKYDYLRRPGSEATGLAAARTFIKEAIEILKNGDTNEQR